MYSFVLVALTLQAPPEANTFVVTSPSLEPETGALLGLTAEFTATLAQRLGRSDVKDVLSLRRPDQPLPAWPTGPQIITTTGDRIAGQIVGGNERSVRFRPTGLVLLPDEAWQIPLGSIAAIWFETTPAETPLDPANYEWAAQNRNRDVLQLRNGDSIRGVLSGLDAQATKPTFSFRPDQGAARKLSSEELTAIVFNPALARFKKPKGPYSRLVLANGSRVHLLQLTIADNRVTGETLFGQKVELPLASILAVDVLQSRADQVGDRKPKKVEQAGFLGVVWPWAANRSARGSQLQLPTPGGVSTFDSGIGTHPRTVLTYDLGGKYQRFEALVGIAPESALRSRAAVRIVVDGQVQKVPGLDLLAPGDALPVRIELQNAKELVLITDFAPGGEVPADINWADARLIR